VLRGHSELEALGGGVLRGGGTTPTGELLNKHTLVRPPRGGWLHRGPHLRVAGMPVVALGSITPCSDESSFCCLESSLVVVGMESPLGSLEIR
jgi:hypothetical protein